ncbi:kallikrein-11-like [Pararge aegeria]|uniref:Jg10316 protein n=1 Tax=Pararge aegeria aegeria TaxID=348720 RepID=A0A8S4RVZ1_9NEOP|nr:kallikrein-11-like [Pararge aegeria]CAH2242782.1 jg10316 [Pararge aegeria aegeria]
MKAACIILTIIICVAIMAVCVMVKFATDITVDEKKRELQSLGGVNQVAKSIVVIALKDNQSIPIAERFPYVAAIARNSSNSWSFACFASVILVKWVVTSAHCRKKGATHRVLLLNDFARNISRTFPILYWRIHEKFNINTTVPMYDIAVAKFNMEATPMTIKPSTFDDRLVEDCEASIWKTVSTMDRKIYLINDFDKLHVQIASPGRCYESYGIQADESMICIDLSGYDDCFVHEFGPIYNKDKVVGILAAKPKDCEVKFAVFTNVSYYATWILKLTHTTAY